MDSSITLLITFYIEKYNCLQKRAVKLSTEELSCEQLECLQAGVMFENFDCFLPGWWKNDDFYKNPVEIQYIYGIEDYTQ